jgi:hypothetical protein
MVDEASMSLEHVPVLQQLPTRIQDAYDSLGHKLGWRFLATPAGTLAPETKLAFVGLNPAGSTYEPPLFSTERGNAYRVERWGANGSPTALQVQVGRMYAEIARGAPGSPSTSDLMDATLAAHFCPFRSPGWAGLQSRQESIEFSAALWRDILDVANPRVLISLSEAGAHLAGVLEGKGAHLRSEPEVIWTGWGDITCGLAHYTSPRGPTLLVRLPHLSRFKIFGRPQSRHAVRQVVDAVQDALWPLAAP